MWLWVAKMSQQGRSNHFSVKDDKFNTDNPQPEVDCPADTVARSHGQPERQAGRAKPPSGDEGQGYAGVFVDTTALKATT